MKHAFSCLEFILTESGMLLNQEGFVVTPLDEHNAELLNKVTLGVFLALLPKLWDNLSF